MRSVMPEYYWLSFTDPERPEGTQFLGACFLEAATMEEAVTRSHELGLNPGGQVMGVGPIPSSEVPEFMGGYMGRLLTKEEAYAMEGGAVTSGELSDEERDVLDYSCQECNEGLAHVH